MSNRDELTRSVGMKIVHYRKIYGLTQEQLAQQIGLDEIYYGQIERGEKRLSIHTLVQLSKYFHVPLDELIPLDGTNTDQSEEKLVAIESIIDILERCSVGQIYFLKSVMQSILPHLK